jgi:hypothetical protein
MARLRALADAAALLAFVVLGLGFHHVPVTAEAVLRNAAPLGVAWFGAAALLGTYRRGTWIAFVANWLLAVPVGLLARQALLGRDLLGQGTWVFVGYGLVATLVLLTVGRALVLVAQVVGRGQVRERSRGVRNA